MDILSAKVYDLGQPYYAGMPHFPGHPPFAFCLNKLHGEFVLESGASSASETLTLGGHVGTHLDALCHFTCGGKLFGGLTPTQSYAGGIEEYPVTSVAPVIRPGVLFDIAGLIGVDALPVDFVITPEHLEACKVEPPNGAVALIRTGWAKYWSDARQFLTGGVDSAVARGPGPKRPAAEWLSRRKIFAAGSDTVAFEHVPSPMEVHVHLIVESGIHIIECLDLEKLAAEGVREFVFVALPLKISGGTGSPIRPVALVG